MDQRVVEALGHIYVVVLPPVSEVSPQVDAQVGRASDEAFVGLVDELVLV